MSVYELKDYSFKYPKTKKNAIENISLTVSEGEFIVLCGASGCGKTTLLRQLKSCLTPAGETRGEILFDSKPLSDASDREQTSRIGFVMQDVENQIVTDKVWHELAFGLESLGCKTDEIRKRVAEMASFFGIEGWFRKSVTELSGGQKQLLNLASVMAMSPDVLILDEPTAQLDPIAAEGFINMLRKLNSETGITIIISEHRAEEVLEICSRVIVMDKGHIICDDTPKNTAAKMLNEHGLTDACTCASRIYAKIDGKGEFPVSVREGREMLASYPPIKEIPQDKEDNRTVIAELKDLWFRYDKEQEDVIRGISLKIYRGEILALLGGNGVGKSTLLSLISGANKPYRGKIKTNGNPLIGAVPQDPQLLFVKKTLSEDLIEVLSDMSYDEKKERAEAAAALCGLTDRLDTHPYDLSGGEQQRAAIAKVLLKAPQILLLDEPTKGMDQEFKRRLAAILKSLAAHGRTIVMVSHDIEFCAMYADRCAMLFDGEISAVSGAREFFLQNRLYTTAARRIARGMVENAVTAEDVIYAVTGSKTEPESIDIDDTLYYRKAEKKEVKKESRLKKYFFGEIPERVGVKKAPLPARTKLAALMLLLFVPLTIFIGVFYLGDKRYYFTSLLVIIESTLPFALIYESKKPKPRELVTIAALCALAVAGRAAFYFLPHFKPITAMVMIAGISFGGEAGFLVGAMSAFVSNFFFGQGAWTPWQMFAFGIIGFLAGEIFRGGIRGRLPVAVFGFLTVLIVYGGIMNFANVTMSQPELTRAALIASYASGIPLDLIHALSTFIFLWIAAVPMLEKLDRVKVKYALI